MLQNILYLQIHRQQDIQDYNKPDTVPKNIGTVEQAPKDEEVYLGFPHRH